MEGSSLLWHLGLCVKLCYKWYWQCHTALLYFLYVVKLCYFMVKWRQVVPCRQLRKQAQRCLMFWGIAERKGVREEKAPKEDTAYTVCARVCECACVRALMLQQMLPTVTSTPSCHALYVDLLWGHIWTENINSKWLLGFFTWILGSDFKAHFWGWG